MRTGPFTELKKFRKPLGEKEIKHNISQERGRKGEEGLCPYASRVERRRGQGSERSRKKQKVVGNEPSRQANGKGGGKKGEKSI